MQREFRGPSGGALARARFETPWSALETAATIPPRPENVASARFDLAPILFGTALATVPTPELGVASTRFVARRPGGRTSRPSASHDGDAFPASAAPQFARLVADPGRFRTSGGPGRLRESETRQGAGALIVPDRVAGASCFAPAFRSRKSPEPFAFPRRASRRSFAGPAASSPSARLGTPTTRTRLARTEFASPGRSSTRPEPPAGFFVAPARFDASTTRTRLERAGSASLNRSSTRREPPAGFFIAPARFGASTTQPRLERTGFASPSRTSTRRESPPRLFVAPARFSALTTRARLERTGFASPGRSSTRPEPPAGLFVTPERFGAPPARTRAALDASLGFRARRDGTSSRRESSRVRTRFTPTAARGGFPGTDDAFFASRAGRGTEFAGVSSRASRRWTERLVFPGLDSLAQRVQARSAARRGSFASSRSSGDREGSRPPGPELAPPSSDAFAGASEPLDLSRVEKLLKESRDALVALADVRRVDMTLDVEN